MIHVFRKISNDLFGFESLEEHIFSILPLVSLLDDLVEDVRLELLLSSDDLVLNLVALLPLSRLNSVQLRKGQSPHLMNYTLFVLPLLVTSFYYVVVLVHNVFFTLYLILT